MVLEQVTGELRTARVVPDQFVGFEGGSNSISFVCTGLPQTARWLVQTNESVALAPVTDLKRITYRLLAGTNYLDVRGLDRVEEMLTGSAFVFGTNLTEFVDTNTLAEVQSEIPSTNEVELIRQPLTSRIKHLQFRYWQGTNWVDSWSGLELPAGVEISVGREIMPLETVSLAEGSASAEDYQPEVFRRVIHLPNSVPLANRLAPADYDEIF
jgi:hypothetical protein